MEWHRLRVFYHVAKVQSITRAAANMNTSQPGVTRCIQQLEYQAKAPLFIRHPRGVTLTKQGEILYNSVKNFMAELEQTKNEILGLSDETSGSLRITTAYGFASTVLFKHLCDFSKQYPDITVNLICDDAISDLKSNTREPDIAFRPYVPNTTEYEQIFLYQRTVHLYASPTYLKEMGTPKKPEDLDYHRLITFENPSYVVSYSNTVWYLSIGSRTEKMRKPFMTVNSVECLYEAAEEGLGIIMLSDDSKLLLKGNLVRVLPDLEGAPVDMHLIYPKSIKNLSTVNILKNFILKKFVES